jgi:hypothetical protein
VSFVESTHATRDGTNAAIGTNGLFPRPPRILDLVETRWRHPSAGGAPLRTGTPRARFATSRDGF